MKHRTIFLIVLVFALIIYAASFIFFQKNKKESPNLTREIAVVLLKQTLINKECRINGEEDQYRTCSVVILKFGDEWEIEIFYDGFHDDSVRGSRIRGRAIYKDGSWELKDDVKIDFRCHLDRGHQDYSTELCI